MKLATLALPLLLLPLVASSVDVPGGPDVIPPGGRRVRPPHAVASEVTVDAGSFASCRCRRYVVANGDTLASVAKRECGDARCADEIRLLNPELQAGEAKAAAAIIIPPSAAASDSRADSRPGTAAAWVVFEDVRSGDARPRPLIAGETSTVSHGPHLQRFLLVRRDKLAAFLGLDWSQAPKGLPDYVVSSGSFMLLTAVPASDPTKKVETHVTLREVKDGALTIDLLERRFDKQGKLLSEQPKELILPPPPRQAQFEIGLAALGLAALALVSFLARRRRQRSGCCA